MLGQSLAALLQVIEVDPVAFDPAAIVGVLDRIVGEAHAAVRLGNPCAVLVLVVGVDYLEEGVLPLIWPDLLRRDDPGPETLLVSQADLHQRPLDPLAGLLPQDACGAQLPALEERWFAGHHVGPVVPFLLDIDAGWRDAAHASVVSDLARPDRLKEDRKPPLMVGLDGFHPDHRRLILERLKVQERIDDRSGQAEDVEPVAVAAAGIADLDDPAVGQPDRRFLAAALLAGLQIDRGVDEGVEGLGWDFQLLPRLHLLERVSHWADSSAADS